MSELLIEPETALIVEELANPETLGGLDADPIVLLDVLSDRLIVGEGLSVPETVV